MKMEKKKWKKKKKEIDVITFYRPTELFSLVRICKVHFGFLECRFSWCCSHLDSVWAGTLLVEHVHNGAEWEGCEHRLGQHAHWTGNENWTHTHTKHKTDKSRVLLMSACVLSSPRMICTVILISVMCSCNYGWNQTVVEIIILWICYFYQLRHGPFLTNLDIKNVAKK